MGGERSSRHGTCDRATDRARGPASGRSPLATFGAASPIFVIEISGNSASALACSVADHSSCGRIRRRRSRRHRPGLERLAVPLHQRGLNFFALRLAATPPNGVAVMRKVGMQPHEPGIAGLVDAGDVPGVAVACRRRADNVRFGIRPRHDACRRSHPAPAAFSRFRPPPVRSQLRSPEQRRQHETRTAVAAHPRSASARRARSLPAGRSPDVAKDFAWASSWALHQRVSLPWRSFHRF